MFPGTLSLYVPRHPPIETRSEYVTLRFTPKQMRAVRRNARRAGKTLSDWIRDTLLVQMQAAAAPPRRLAPLPPWPAIPSVPAPVRPALRKAT